MTKRPPTLYELNPAFKPTFDAIKTNTGLYDKARKLLKEGKVPRDLRPYIEQFTKQHQNQIDLAYDFSRQHGILDNPDVIAALGPHIRDRRVGAAMEGVRGVQQDVLGKLDQVAGKVGADEKAMMQDIAAVREGRRRAVAAQAQEQAELAHGLATRRGFGTEAMAQNVLADIENVAAQQRAEVDEATMNKALAAQHMYNTLLQNLFLQYRDTKSASTLQQLQAVMGVLEQINMIVERGQN